MYSRFVHEAIEHSDRIVHTEMTREAASLRADIASYDQQIEHYEQEIAESDRKTEQMAMELQTLHQEYVL